VTVHIYDSIRKRSYAITTTDSTEKAKKAVQNGQWQEALDHNGVTPVEHLLVETEADAQIRYSALIAECKARLDAAAEELRQAQLLAAQEDKDNS
jgi:hypothetical protein